MRDFTFGLVLVIAFLLCCYAVKPQTPSHTVKDQKFGKAEKKKVDIEVANTTEFLNKVDFPNGVDMSEHPSIHNETSFNIQVGRNLFNTSAGIAIPFNQNQSNVIASVGVGWSRNLGKFQFSTNGKYYGSKYREVGIAGVELSRTFSLAKKTELKVFSNVSQYIPAGPQIGHFENSSGTVFRNGFKFDSKDRFVKPEFGVQLINDTGAIIPVDRFGMNFEAGCFLPYKLWLIGPKIGYTRFFKHEGFEKANHFQYGFAVKLP